MMRASSRRRLSPLLLLAVAAIALTAALILIPRPASADHRDHHHGPGDGCGIYELDVFVGDGTRHQVDKISRDSTNPTEVKVSAGNPEITVKRQPMDRFVWVYRLHYDDSRPEQYRLARLARFPNRAWGPDFYFRFYLTDEEGSAPLEVGESRMVRIFLWVKHDRLEDCDYKALLAYHLKITRVADDETLGFVPQSTQQPSGMSGDAPPPPDNRPPTISSAISDTIITNESGWQVIPLAGVFADADGDPLTLEATSSNYAVAFGYVQYLQGAELVVLAGQRGTAQITVAANDERGGRISDTFEVTVKAAPTVASALADIGSLDEGASKQISLSGVFSDADGDGLTVTASSSNDAVTKVAVAADSSSLTVSGQGAGTATITVTAEDSDGNSVSYAFDITVVKGTNPPTVASAIDDARITNENGTSEVSLSGVFSDADGDDLTVTASSSDQSVATVSVSTNHSTLTLSAQSRGVATVTVTATDGRGGSVEDSFTVQVKAAPVVTSAIVDLSELEVEAKLDISLSGVFSDADGDALTISAASADDGNVTVAVTADQSKLTVAGVAEGTATITVTAEDADGNRVSDRFDVTVTAPPNDAPTVASAIADATIVNESGSHQVSLSGVFSDADGDDLAVKASSSDESVATVAVSNDTLTVAANSRGAATITVTADDGAGGTVSDTFKVTVKAAPVLARAIPDATMVEFSSKEVDLSKVFSDVDDDTLAYTASSTDEDVVAAYVFQGALTVLAITEGEEIVTVTAQDADGNRVSDRFDVTVTAPPNNAPTVSTGIADATIANQSGTHQVSLAGVFSDADGDDLTITAASSAESVATVAVSNNTLTVTAKSRGTATITVTADDGAGGTVSDTFSVTVNAGPKVASAIADIGALEAEASREISLSGVFNDPDGDALTISVTTSDRAIVNISTALDGTTLSATAVTVIGVAEGTATITVTAQDSDGNRVSDAFDVTVPAAEAEQQQQVEAIPGQVVNLSVRQVQPTRIRVQWEAPEDGGAVNSYQVVLSRDGEELSIRRPGAKKHHVVIRKLEPGATYTVSVRAKNATGLSAEATVQITLTVSIGVDDPAEAPAQKQQQIPVSQR